MENSTLESEIHFLIKSSGEDPENIDDSVVDYIASFIRNLWAENGFLENENIDNLNLICDDVFELLNGYFSNIKENSIFPFLKKCLLLEKQNKKQIEDKKQEIDNSIPESILLMFPSLSIDIIQNVWNITNHSINETIDSLLNRNSNIDSDQLTQTVFTSALSTKEKMNITNRFDLIETDALYAKKGVLDSGVLKPMSKVVLAPKVVLNTPKNKKKQKETKNQIRYVNNEVVSRRGERVIRVPTKKQELDDKKRPNMDHTFVTIDVITKGKRGA